MFNEKDFFELIDDKEVIDNYRKLKSAGNTMMNDLESFDAIYLLLEQNRKIKSYIRKEKMNNLNLYLNLFWQVYSYVLYRMFGFKKDEDFERMFRLLYLYSKFENEFLNYINKNSSLNVSKKYLCFYLILETKNKILKYYYQKIDKFNFYSFYDCWFKESTDRVVENANNVVKVVKKNKF